jgi:hypothetical protein
MASQRMAALLVFGGAEALITGHHRCSVVITATSVGIFAVAIVLAHRRSSF